MSRLFVQKSIEGSGTMLGAFTPPLTMLAGGGKLAVEVVRGANQG